MSTTAGSTAKGGILGRRKRAVPEPASFVTMWGTTADGRPELVRCRLSDVRVPVERDHGFRWKMITQSGGT